MKLILLTTILMICGFVSGVAQVQTAVLKHDDNVSFYYGHNSFLEAYNAASEGDVITLSTGNFASVDTISKSISVIGRYAFSSNEDMTAISNMVIAADDVILSGIRVIGTVRMNLTRNLTLKRCYIENLVSDTLHVRTFIEDCAVKNDFSLPTGVEESYRRCDIDRYHWGNSPDNPAIFEYCYVRNVPVEDINVRYSHGLRYYDNQLSLYGTLKNSILYWSQMVPGQSTAQAALYFNPQSNYSDILLIGGLYGNVAHVIPDGTLAQYIDEKFMDTDTVLEVIKDFPSFYYDTIVIPMEGNWDYESVVGCYEHKSYPAIPRIIDSNISRETDNNGKITVSITISTEEN
ncbi:MAG: hypothetical protein HDR88_06650 [Bacteroides sp.]|nr:hypothetical protein [Bacteroides sp.]